MIQLTEKAYGELLLAAARYQKVRNCVLSGEHDLVSIKIMLELDDPEDESFEEVVKHGL